MAEENEFISGRKQIKIELVAVAKVFMIACIVGSAAIVFGVLFNSIILSVVAPLGIMGAYIFYMTNSDTDLPISIIGDSFYYLGFILTLVALVVSLISLASSSQVNMNSIVGSFGAALTTTIVGLIARLVVTSFSVQAKERRERLENEIEKSLTRFSGQLDLLTTEVIASISKVHAQTESTISETVDRFKTVHDDVLGQYIDSMEKCDESVQVSINDLATRINNIEVSPELVVAPLKESLKGITSTLDQHQREYAQINSNMVDSNAALSSQFKNTGTLVQDHINKLETEVGFAIKNQAQVLEGSLNGIGNSIVSSLGEIKELKNEAQDGVNSKLSLLSVELDAVISSIKSLREPIELSTREVVNTSDKMAESLNKLFEAADKVDAKISSTNLNAEKITNIHEDLDKLSSSILVVNENFQTVSNTSQETVKKMSSAASATEAASTQVAKDITDVYKKLALQIRALKSVA